LLYSEQKKYSEALELMERSLAVKRSLGYSHLEEDEAVLASLRKKLAHENSTFRRKF
jgi:hypothetical protein